MKHGASAYNDGRCRCPICRAANTAKVARRRARRRNEKLLVRVTESSTLVSAPVSPSDHARQDMEDILSALASDSDWRSFVEEGEPGEVDSLITLIDRHNRLVRFPRIQYGYENGNLWVGASDEMTEPVTVATEITTETTAPVAQLPRHVPLAKPRTVPRGVAPTVPRTPTPGVASGPTWG
jgi:hypothetical protein